MIYAMLVAFSGTVGAYDRPSIDPLFPSERVERWGGRAEAEALNLLLQHDRDEQVVAFVKACGGARISREKKIDLLKLVVVESTEAQREVSEKRLEAAVLAVGSISRIGSGQANAALEFFLNRLLDERRVTVYTRNRSNLEVRKDLLGVYLNALIHRGLRVRVQSVIKRLPAEYRNDRQIQSLTPDKEYVGPPRVQ